MVSLLSSMRVAAAIAVSTLAGTALAADPASMAAANERYQQERARCLAGLTPQDQQTCLREAGAALQAARRGQAEDPPSDLDKNRLRRCDVFTNPAEREECIRRMNFGVTTGSVEGGGVVRELRTQTVP